MIQKLMERTDWGLGALEKDTRGRLAPKNVEWL